MDSRYNAVSRVADRLNACGEVPPLGLRVMERTSLSSILFFSGGIVLSCCVCPRFDGHVK